MSDEIKKECDGNCAGCGQNSTCEEAKKEQENAVENEFKGLDYMIKLSYACVDRCEEMDYGKKRNLHRNDFLKFADSCGIERTVANRLIDRLISKRDIFETIVNSSFLTEELKEKLRCLIFDRIEAIR